MKSKRFYLTMIVGSIVLLGTTYAAQTERLQMTSTVATGELNVALVKAKGERVITAEEETNSEKAIKKIDITPTSTGFSYMIKNLYPGESYTINAVFVNQGTIPARIENIDLNLKEGEDGEVLKRLRMCGTAKVGEKEIIKVKEEDMENVGVQDFIDQINKALASQILEIGDVLEFQDWKVVALPSKFEYDDTTRMNPGEGEKLEFIMSIHFVQGNINMSTTVDND